MPDIKRYPNRKLYDTAAKQYVSLEGIALMIRRGEDVQIVEYATGEDVTTLVLTQIIVEQERQRSGFLPRSVLTGLIQSGGHTLASLRRSLSTPLDLFRQVDEEIERRLQQLVALGDLAEGEAQLLLDKLTAPAARGDMLPSARELEQGLRTLGPPTRGDLQVLSGLLDQLAAQVDELTAAHSDTMGGDRQTVTPAGMVGSDT